MIAAPNILCYLNRISVEMVALHRGSFLHFQCRAFFFHNVPLKVINEALDLQHIFYDVGVTTVCRNNGYSTIYSLFQTSLGEQIALNQGESSSCFCNIHRPCKLSQSAIDALQTKTLEIKWKHFHYEKLTESPTANTHARFRWTNTTKAKTCKNYRHTLHLDCNYIFHWFLFLCTIFPETFRLSSDENRWRH